MPVLPISLSCVTENLKKFAKLLIASVVEAYVTHKKLCDQEKKHERTFSFLSVCMK